MVNYIPPFLGGVTGTVDGVVDQRYPSLLVPYRLGLLASGLGLTYFGRVRPDISVSLQVGGAYGLASSLVSEVLRSSA